ncbi:hypothetical protein D9M71_517740 [compost metagenome]
MGIGQAGFDTEFAAAEKAAGFIVQVRYALRRFRIFLERLPIGAARGSGCTCGHRLAALRRFGRGFGQAFGGRGCWCCFDLTNALLKYHQRVLLCFVPLFQLHEFLF